MTDNRLETALQYAAVGIPVFPVNQNKTPCIKQWGQKATTDKEQIEKWYKETFIGGCNFGAAVGRADIVVIDTDHHSTEQDGEYSLSAFLKEKEIKLPETFTVHTPSGGIHRYYKASGYRSKNKFLPAVDIKSNGGYVVIQGSSTDKGTYTLLNGSLSTIANLPEEFKNVYNEKVTPRTKQGETVPNIEWDSPADIAKAVEYLKTAPVAVEGDGGYSTTLMVIDQLGDFGISPEKTFELLTEEGGWNDKCDPPWDDAELLEKITSLYGRSRHNPLGCKSEAHLVSLFPDAATEDTATEDTAPGTPPPFDFGLFLHNADYYLQMQNTELEYYIEGFLPVRYVTNLFYGSAGEGKTTVMYQMLQCIMTSTPFLGLKTQKRDARPLVVSMEEPGEDIANRLKDQQKGVSGNFGDLPIINLFGQSVDFFTYDSKTGKITGNSKWEDFTEYVKKWGYNLIVIDNLGRLFPGDENNRVAVSTFGNILNRFCEEAKAQILIIAHNNKTGTYSGSSAWDAIARNRYSWERKGDRDEGFKCRLSVTKSNYIPKGAAAYAEETANRLFTPISKAEYEAAAKKDVEFSDFTDAVEDIFKENSNTPLSITPLCNEIWEKIPGLKQGDIKGKISELVELGTLSKDIQKDTKGHKKDTYRLR